MSPEEADCVVTRLSESNFDRIKSINGFMQASALLAVPSAAQCRHEGFVMCCCKL